MNRAVSTLFLSILTAAFAFGQPTTPPPAFDGADVHVSPLNAKQRGGMSPDGRLELRGSTMLDLITFAYGVEPDKVIGGPVWLDKDRFDVIAKSKSVGSQDVLKEMLQALLADRFKLATHAEERPFPAFALVATPYRGPQLKASSGSGAADCTRGTVDGLIHLDCHNITIAALAERLPNSAPNYFNLPVVDRTGITGSFDIALKWTGRGALSKTADPASNISLFDYFEKELGIKVDKITQPTRVIIVDKVNQAPTPNPPGVSDLLPPPPTEFDVAEIHASRPGAQQNADVRNGRVQVTALSLRDLVTFAYDFNDDMVVGGEKWIDSDRFDLIAKAAPTATIEDMRPMLRKLLEERFKLKIHTEDRPVDVFALTDPRHTTRLKQTATVSRASCQRKPADGQLNLVCVSTTTADLAVQLRQVAGGYLNRPVVDLTGLKGAYDFTVSWIPAGRAYGSGGRGADSGGAAASDSSGGLTIFEAVDKQLGLKLAAQKHPMPVVVIDHAEHIPTEN
jgi:uncharacterized protein (TIGR03435 family)